MRFLRSVFFCVVLFVTGCIRLEQTFTINKNGSGSFKLSYSVSEQSIIQMQAMLNLRKQLADISEDNVVDISDNDYISMLLNPSEDQIRAEVGKYKDNGITIERLNIETRNAWRYIRLDINFRSIEDLAKADFFSKYGFFLTKNKNGDYEFYRVNANDKPSDLSNSENIKSLTPILKGMHIVLRIITPGKILKTNAMRNSRYMAEWIFDFNDDQNILLTLQHQDMKILFDGKNLSIPEVDLNMAPIHNNNFM